MGIKILLYFLTICLTVLLVQHNPEFTALLFIIGGLLLILIGKAGHYEKTGRD